MRLTVNVDDDLYAVAKALARAEDCSLSAAFNRLVRRAVEPRGEVPLDPSLGGIPVVPCRETFDSDDVYDADLEDAAS